MINMGGSSADDFKEFDDKTNVVFDKSGRQSW